MQIIDGRKIAEKILQSTKDEVAQLSFVPVFCDVLVGDDPSSEQYVRMKQKKAEAVGMEFHTANFPASITTDELIAEIQKLNKVAHMCGIIVQLPLPTHIDRRAVLDAIDPALDVDCLGSVAQEKFYQSYQPGDLVLPTASAVMETLNSIEINLKEKKILILGAGDLVGKPVAALLTYKGYLPVVVDSKVENKAEIIKAADVIISGIGQGRYITGEMIHDGVVIIDAGTSESNGAIVGDVDFESVKDLVSYISPVPGGVGPVTVACLLQNVLNVAKKQYA